MTAVEATSTESGSRDALVNSYLGRKKQIVVLVDPYSTGCLVGQEIAKRGYLLICVWTYGFADIMKQHVPLSCGKMQYYGVVDQDVVGDSLEATAEAIRQVAGRFPVVSIMAGGDRGVDLADALSEHFGLLTNGTEIPNRRDKKVQQELVRASGLRAVRQAGGDKFADVEEFLRTEPYPLVVKPIESSGSDAVKLCSSFEEAKAHFEMIMNTSMVDGGENTGVLTQEFLRGREHIIDHVSRDGVHKTMMVYVYDKRPANGAAFVYYGCIPVDSESPEAKILIEYTRGVLDAIGVKNGASHTEVMLTADGPCLVEVNCRTNGGDGIWRPMVRALTGGYTQVEATADSYLDAERFDQYPDKHPSPFKAAGCEIELVSYDCGVVKATPGYTMISHLPSFVHLESHIAAGSTVEYTIDLDTCVGTVCLMHPEQSVVDKDIEFIRYMEDINGIFQFEPVSENLKRPRPEAIAELTVSVKPKGHHRVFSAAGQDGLIRHMSMNRHQLRAVVDEAHATEADLKEVVIMVDPYSTGSLIAVEVMKHGFQVVALWTTTFPTEMRQRVPASCGKLDYFAEVEQGGSIGATIKAIQEKTAGLSIVACIPGDDLGVDLVDSLSEKLGIRTNGTAISKRNKKVQQDLISKAGLRSIRQQDGSDFADVALFLKTERFPVVIKPAVTAGSDGVKLCFSFEDAKKTFEEFKQSQVLSSLDVPSILVQESIKGRELLVDNVSRDGVHKTLFLWSLDKRPANGASQVHFGLVPEPCDSDEAQIIIPYVRTVLDTLGILNGPSHVKVSMTATGPCLIKVSCTAHGGDGNWRSMCRAMTGGPSQIEATVDAYLDEAQFESIPDIPPTPFKASGIEVLLVSFSRGLVQATPGFDIIKNLASFVYLETGVTQGSEVDYTTDLFSSVGSVILMHYDSEILERDVDRIRGMEENNTLFEYDLEAGQYLGDMTPFVHAVSIPGDRPEII